MGLTDPAWLGTSFVVIDFETVTPAGRRPEPVEVAALALRAGDGGQLTDVGRFEALIRPPGDVMVTAFDTAQTGITPAMLQDADPASVVMARLEARLTRPPYFLVAQNASYEAGLLYDQRANCPALARTSLIDTMRLARVAYPELARHRLDDLLRHLGIATPPGRHRAMPDVEATAQVFTRLVDDGAAAGHWRTLAGITAVGGLVPRAVDDDREAGRPRQESLFG